MINTSELKRINTIVQKKFTIKYGSPEAAREVAIVVKSISTKPSEVKSEADIKLVIDDYSDGQFNITVSLLDIIENIKHKYYYVYNINVITEYLSKVATQMHRIESERQRIESEKQEEALEELSYQNGIHDEEMDNKLKQLGLKFNGSSTNGLGYLIYRVTLNGKTEWMTKNQLLRA